MGCLWIPTQGKSETSNTDRHIEVAMRMIGHRLLQSAGDSTSLVLPIEKDADTYTISFGSELAFNPDSLAVIVASVAEETGFATAYIVGVEQCETEETVHSFEIRPDHSGELFPCSGREYPKDCYRVLISLLPYGEEQSGAVPQQKPSETGFGWMGYGLILVLSLVIYIGFRLVKRKSKLPITQPHLIQLGHFQLDVRNSTLCSEEGTTELTGKESDLLILLYNSANTTIEKEVLLREVWGDEGDYIGRTLDVYISKLRKKLESDQSLKIINTRGVGYKLVTGQDS